MSGKTLKQRMLAILTGWIAVVLLWSSPTFGALPFEFQDDNVREAVQAGDSRTAIQLLEAAVGADPNYYVDYFNLGLIYYDLEQFGQAKQWFSDALERKSKHYPTMYYLGKTLIYLGEIDAAEEYMRQGLKKAKNEKAWFENGVGLVEVARENYGEADKAFRRALALNEETQGKRIKDLQNTKLEENVRTYRVDSLTAAFAHENAEYYINLGDANFYQGVPGLAITYYEKALEVDTASTEVYYHWAEACLEMKDYTCALDKLRIVLTKDSTHAAAWNRAGAIYFKAALSTRGRDERKQRFVEAIGSYKKYFELTNAVPDSSTVRPYFEIAMSYANIYGFEDAVEYFDKVLSIPYEPRDVYFHYGKSLWGIKDYVKAATILKKHESFTAAKMADDDDYTSGVRDWELYQLLGDSYFYRKPKDFTNATRYYVKSLDDRPEQRRILQNTAIAFHSNKSYCEALEYYDKRIAMGIDSTSASIYKNAGLCALNLAGNSDEEEFEEEFEDAAVADPCADPTKDYFQVAIDYMNEFLTVVPNDTTVILRVANTYLYQLQDVPNGVSYFERLLSITPDNCLAKKSIGYAYFGIEGHKNYTKALRHLEDAYGCFVGSGGACEDAATVKWIAQCYHLRAADKTEGAAPDYEKAFEWYGKVLKCDPNDSEAQKARDDIRYEF